MNDLSVEEFDKRLREMLQELASKGIVVGQISPEYVSQLGGRSDVLGLDYVMRSRR